jgi:glutathione S-transferase
MEAAMLKIFHVPGTRSNRVIWLAEEMGIPYETKAETFGQFSDEFMAANPCGAMPAIVEDGVGMGESVAIMHYLTERYGPTPLALKPDDPRYSDYVQFLVFGEASLAAYLNPVFMTNFMAPEDQRANVTVDFAKTLFKSRLRSIDAQLAKGDYMAGDFTAADISVGYALGIGAAVGLDADYSPAVKSYMARVQARPAFQAMQAVK